MGCVPGEDSAWSSSTRRIKYNPWRIDVEAILQRNFQAIGIKLDIQNYPAETFFGPSCLEGKASPPTGAVSGRYDIAEF